MSSEEQLKALLTAADEALPAYRTKKPGGSLTDEEAKAVLDLGKFWLLFDDGVKDGQMGPYLGVPTLLELERQLRTRGVDAKSQPIKLHTHNLAREARQLAAAKRKAELDDALRLRTVARESTTADTDLGTRPDQFEDPTGIQFFGNHEAGDE